MDELRAKSEKELKRIERELTKIYEQSQKEIHEKWDSYLQRAAERTKKLEEALEKAKASGDTEKIKEAQEALKRKVDSVTRQDAKFNAMARETAERLTDVNAIATAYINNEMPKVYALNYNGMIEDIENDLEGINTGIAFNLVDERTIKQLVKDDKLLYSNKTLDKAADMKWNLKAITSQVTQGIIQGESIPKIAKRLDNVSDMDKNAAIRSARTLTTTAENSGRMAGIKEAEDKGIVYEKQWMATPDDRTRESHAELDGVSVPLEEPFPNGLMYPADMSGDPEEVWNCRCSMVRKLIGFRRDDGSISEVGDIEHYERRIGEEKKTEEQPENKSTLREIEFTPAENIFDAETYARNNFVEGGFFNLTGKDVSFKGVDIEVANRINKRLEEIYTTYDIDKLQSLEAFGKANKKIYSAHTDAPMYTTNFGNIGLNSTLLSSENKIAEYVKKGEESFEYVINNKSVLSGKSLELAEIYEKAGRSLVDNSIEGMITHEVGHHLSYMSEVNKELSSISQSGEWQKYAETLSGYANTSFGEYIAESFTAYINSEEIQPEIKKIFDGLKKK